MEFDSIDMEFNTIAILFKTPSILKSVAGMLGIIDTIEKKEDKFKVNITLEYVVLKN